MNPLYEFISHLKERINRGEISGHTALDLFFQQIEGMFITPDPMPEAPPMDNAHVAEGCEQFADPVPEPATVEPVDGQTTAAETV